MKLCVVAGEASGDLHAAEVMRELRTLDPDLELFGIGGDGLAAEGLRRIRDARDLAIVGLFNVLGHLPMYFRALRDLIRAIERERPDAILLVDYPDFNLRVAARAKTLGIPVFYYISPQVWAWRKRRVRQIAERVDQMFVIFPFEKELYDQRGVEAMYVGHPLVGQLSSVRPRSSEPPSAPFRIAILPGSRRMEVDSLLRPALGAVEIMKKSVSVESFVVLAPTIERSQIARLIGSTSVDVRIIEGEERLPALAGADLAICSSGTATLESAILGVPPVVVYRLPPLTYAVARRMVRLPYFSLVNIVAGKGIVPELIQQEVSAERVAQEALAALEPSRWSRIRGEIDLVREKLGTPGAARRVAEKIATLIDRRTAAIPS
ncbi:MAG TPA: lipid-A-disaccharide synthase [Thermoanaerobaculia bacterium]|nr:lipid-A-disaccharide synthase [Thermoanaerobaculia bacterium]